MVNIEEIWKDVPGWEEYYQASNLGNLKSKARPKTNPKWKGVGKPEMILKPQMQKGGYLGTVFRIGNVYKSLLVHRIIMLTFKGESNLQVDHINGNPKDNRLENLRYCTNRENSHFRFLDRKQMGVREVKGRWCAYTYFNGKQRWLGSYKTFDEAAKANKEANERIISPPLSNH